MFEKLDTNKLTQVKLKVGVITFSITIKQVTT